MAMTEYVEARYALIVLREARLADGDMASKLVADLLRDLGSLQSHSSMRDRALKTISVLAEDLHNRRWLHLPEWEAAHEAAAAWCESALH